MFKSSKTKEQRSARRRSKITITNSRTKRRMQIAADKHLVVVQAIRSALARGKSLTYTELLKAVKKKLHAFPGSVGWYLISVIRNMESEGKVLCKMTSRRPYYSLAGR
ncbi:MAG TPA: hypothetical protein VL361_10800 [Candidatus Limnocylindrales bacterium]|jgi:hypothetical protein|nr:hypothetical protein [Candidatus Limnocylindrales bacterium]